MSDVPLKNYMNMGHSRGVPRVAGMPDKDTLTRPDGTIDHAASAEANRREAAETMELPKQAIRGILTGSSVFDGGSSTLPHSVNALFGATILLISPVMLAEAAIDRLQAWSHARAAARGALTVTDRTPPAVRAAILSSQGG